MDASRPFPGPPRASLLLGAGNRGFFETLDSSRHKWAGLGGGEGAGHAGSPGAPPGQPQDGPSGPRSFFPAQRQGLRFLGSPAESPAVPTQPLGPSGWPPAPLSPIWKARLPRLSPVHRHTSSRKASEPPALCRAPALSPYPLLDLGVRATPSPPRTARPAGGTGFSSQSAHPPRG